MDSDVNRAIENQIVSGRIEMCLDWDMAAPLSATFLKKLMGFPLRGRRPVAVRRFRQSGRAAETFDLIEQGIVQQRLFHDHDLRRRGLPPQGL